MNIPIAIIEELKSVAVKGLISNPNRLFTVTFLSEFPMNVIMTQASEVSISKMSLKHIIDQRGEYIIFKIQDTIDNYSKIIDNSSKRPNSFIFVKMNGKASGAVVEVTKTPDGNRVVSAFPIDRKTYRKLRDISGRSDVPP